MEEKRTNGIKWTKNRYQRDEKNARSEKKMVDVG